jgi:capsular polysaccharide transport system permease protein
VNIAIKGIEMTDKTSFRRSLTIQGRVIYALLMREVITRYGRHNIGFMWLFVEPMLFTLGVTALWTATKAAHGSNLPIVAFAVTGYSSVLLWRNGATRCAKAIEPNLSLLYHRNVRVIDVLASRLILEIAGATISVIVITLVFVSIGWMTLPSDVLRMMVAWFLLSWFAVSLGLVVAAMSERSEMFDRIWHTVTYLIFPLSGAVFMVDWLPKAAQELVLWIPMVHGVEMLRHGYFGDAVRTHESVAYLMLANLFLLLIGLALVRETGRRVEPA